MLQVTIGTDVLRNSFLFSEIDDTILREVVTRCERVELLAGEKLYEQESEPDAMYILEAGQIHLVRHYPDGHEVVLATKIPDHVIGELSMLSGRLHTGSVVAVGDCDLIKLTREAVYDICEQFPCIAQQALTHMAARLHTLNLHARESALGDTQARVASVLLMVANPPAGRVAGEISVARLARATALDVDMVEHMLKSWEREGVVTFQRGQLTLHDVEVLQRIAG